MQAAKLGGLRDKLALGKLTNISFLVVNEQDAQSRALYWELKRRTAEGIPVYQQSPLQNDMWPSHLPHCPALQFPSLPLYRSCHQGYVPQKYMQLLITCKLLYIRRLQKQPED
ncbi:hypothetical protein G5714_001828 [Onychostoma macrolepis]|uniref:Selenoprotein P N-terminal domain-containing protein n=1 Tax=Onychostoma macrolepis TaxID=369639 RepID=A0A7J6DE34_9TELE|nr:hypothetical protein G5714_001828 [Onychostoma macrolepis]